MVFLFNVGDRANLIVVLKAVRSSNMSELRSMTLQSVSR